MTYKLSVLDLSPVPADGTAAGAIRDSVALAAAADRLGYHRYWVAEHHNTDSFGGTAPEVLLAAMTQQTSRIRLGSGGVMLVNHSPLKVAENFLLLEALAPGRIDLGVGRALGTDARTGGALRSAGSEAFSQYFALTQAWLLDACGRQALGADHPARGIQAMPSGPNAPELFVLCSSADSAAAAGQMGVGMVFAEFIAAGQPFASTAAEAVASYKAAFQPSVWRETPWAGVGTQAFAADTAAGAERLDGPRRAWSLAFLEGRREGFLNVDQAAEALAGRENDPRLAQVLKRAIVGDAAAVRAALDAKAAETGADELFVIASGPSLDARVRSLELMLGG